MTPANNTRKSPFMRTGMKGRSTLVALVLLTASLCSLLLIFHTVEPATTQASPINLVENGSFEDPDIMTGTWKMFNNIDPKLPGWDLTSGTDIEVQDRVFGWKAKDGDQLVELDSFSPTRISQEVPTQPGTNYELRYAFSPRPGTPKEDNKLEVTWNSTQKWETSKDGTGLKQTSWGKLPFTHCVAGNSMFPTTLLSFQDRGDSNKVGTFIDAVSVVESQCITDVEYRALLVKAGAIIINGEPAGTETELSVGNTVRVVCPDGCRIETNVVPTNKVVATDSDCFDPVTKIAETYGNIPDPWTVNVTMLLAGCVPEAQQSVAAADVRMGFVLQEGGMRNRGVYESLTLSIGTSVATVESVGAKDFSVSHDPDAGVTTIICFLGSITVTPANPALPPFTLQSYQEVQVTADSVSPITNLIPVFLPTILK